MRKRLWQEAEQNQPEGVSIPLREGKRTPSSQEGRFLSQRAFLQEGIPIFNTGLAKSQGALTKQEDGHQMKKVKSVVRRE